MEKESPPVEVLVVGAGPVGLTAACELVRRGVSVRIIDKAPTVSPTSRALAIFPRSLEVFSFMGVASEMLSAGRRLTGIEISGEQGPLGQLDLSILEESATPFPFVLSLAQSDTERILGRHLARLGVSVERGVELIGFAQGERGVRAILRRWEGRPGGGATEESVHAEWLLGCDGAHSTVRHILGATFEGRSYHEAFALADVTLEASSLFTADQAHLFFSKAGLFGVIPFNTGGTRHTRIIANLPGLSAKSSVKGAEPTLAEFEAYARQRGAGHARFHDSTWVSRFNIAYRMVRSFQHGRVFLAGDAAHVHSPAGGQGMNTGIQDAFNLGWKLALVVKGRSPVHLLATYGGEREPVARGVLRFTNKLTRLATLRNGLLRKLRDAVLPFVLRSQPTAMRAARRLAGFDVHYVDSNLSEDLSGQPLRAGDRAPDVRLTDATTGKTRTLFELFADTRLILLAFAGLHARPESLSKIASLQREIEEAYRDVIVMYPILRADSPQMAFHAPTGSLLDQSGAAHLLYESDAGGIVLVRPDGYIGFRSGWDHEGKLRGYLGEILGSR